MTGTKRNLKQEWDAIDHDDRNVEARKWALAKRLAARKAELGSYTKVAGETGRKVGVVRWWTMVGEQFDQLNKKTFTEALYAVRGVTSKEHNEGSDRATTKRILRKADPEQIESMLSELPASQIEKVADAVSATRVARARPPERRKPTAGELMDGEKWDPSESWMDTQVIRLNNNARGLAAHVEKWGPVLGSMTWQEVFDYLKETEKLVAELRVIAQTNVRDGVTA